MAARSSRSTWTRSSNRCARAGKRFWPGRWPGGAPRGVKLKPVLVEKFGGLVADVIISQAKKQRADLIVLGTHGRRGVTRLVMGSDAEGVVRRSPVPVLLVRK